VKIHARRLWRGGAWAKDALVTLGPAGRIVGVQPGVVHAPDAGDVVRAGTVVPGFFNAHSHAFQYAMAGLAEHLPTGAAGDDFWSWREAMYALALRVDPDDVETIATTLYAEMLRHGYTHVAEFHYVHHTPDGKPYADLGELSARLLAAAERTGIRLTLLPVFYQRGGFAKEAQPTQRRFISKTRDDYLRLVERVRELAKGKATVGAAVHSLRAVSPDDVKAVMRDPALSPMHIHVAEQLKEVEECLATYEKRPVAWLLDEVGLSDRHWLVHATHMTSDETKRLAASGAMAVVCPSTEANLGDGFFDLAGYRAAQGRWCIGSDSHVGISPLEDLRWLDYGHRLKSLKRNVLCTSAGQDSGTLIMSELGKGTLDLGTPFDALELDERHPALAARPNERLLSSFIYAGDAGAIKNVWVGGKPIARGDGHRAKFAATLQKLARS